MKDPTIRDSYQPHTDYNQVRPLTAKDLQPLDPAVRSYVQAHAYGVELRTNHLI
ncbi:hypothetical protein [Secundilactobacillus folii]|uniref:Uncharacterized protein n=1 Tax=Secundilactobacillus folii TaxID=2678357 RepID=A0A7X2XWZ9_9LACO|nr:hypothetical protein [Secundilactobacillus folii]MTV82483.1 hypothetical protein [Secundilactobacillus folii]